LGRWTVEPYGLGFRKKALETLGAAPVVYGGEADWEKLPQDLRYRFQLETSPAGEWWKEDEWRLADDLALDRLAPGDWFIVVPTLEEAWEINHLFRRPVWAPGSMTGEPINPVP
jgi:hypothetical protein